ncbi:4Fe-4S binding protein [Gordonibacter sp.]|uniref:4Fe-4S binding protein n=1 Tax=Gordonibacter sp. TaxID=1968902 RepID=UPI002FC5B004
MKQGDRITKARVVTLALVFAAVIASLAFDTGIGTPSAFGIGQFFLLCPLGGIEALLASKAFVPVTLISLAVVTGFALLFGRAWCAWGCPAPRIRGFFRRNPKVKVENNCGEGAGGGEEMHSGNKAYPPIDLENAHQAAPGASKGFTDHSGQSSSTCAHTKAAAAKDLANKACKTCTASSTHQTCSGTRKAKGLAASLRYLGRDKRTWALSAVLLATLVAGIPLFCLVCPIGLTFGTVGSLWHLIVDKQMTLSAIVFPAALAIELVLYRKWCLNLCPVAGLLNVFGQFARTFRPRIDASTCLRTSEGAPCTACASACAERIDLHAADATLQLGECTRCGECVKHCPTASIHIEVKPSAPVEKNQQRTVTFK